MAVFTADLPQTAPGGGSFFRRVDEMLSSFGKARDCAHQVEMLSGLTDAQLAKRGLTPRTVVRHAARAYL